MKICYFTVGFDGSENLLSELDLLDVLDIRVGEKEELVSQHEVRLLRSFLAFHGGSVTGSLPWAFLCAFLEGGGK